MTPRRFAPLVQRVTRMSTVRREDERTDRELVRAYAQHRDESAFTTLVQRYGPMVFNVCRRVLRGHHDAEDAFQAAFLVLARKAARLRRPEAISSWLYGVAQRVALKAKSGADRREQREHRSTPASPVDPLSEITLREAQAIFDEELAKLPEKYRAPLILCSLEGVTRDEAAQRLQTSLGRLKHRLHQGRALLRNRLIRRGVDLSVVSMAVSMSHDVSAGVPEPLARSVVAASVGPPSQVLSPHSLTLADEIMKSTFSNVMKLTTVALIGLVAMGLGVTLAVPQDEPAPPAASASTQDGDPGTLKDRNDPLPTNAVARLGTARFRHENWVLAAEPSPDGKLIASIGGKSLILWNAETGRMLHRLPTGVMMGAAIDFSSDGKILAAGGPNNEIRLWDPQTGKLITTLKGPRPGGRPNTVTNSVSFVEFIGDGKKLISRGPDQIVRIWDGTTGRQEKILEDVRQDATIPTLSPDGKLIATAVIEGDNTQVVNFYDVAEGKLVQRWVQPSGKITRFAFSPDGKILAMGIASGTEDDERYYAELWDVQNGKRIHELGVHKGEVIAFVFTPDGKRLVTSAAYPDRAVRLWAVTSGKLLSQFDVKHPLTRPTAFLDDGKTVLTAGPYHTIQFFNVLTGEQRHQPDGHVGGIGSVAFARDGRTIVTAVSGAPGTMILWEGDGFREALRLREPQPSPSAVSIAMSPTDPLMAQATSDGSVRIWDLKHRQIIKKFGFGGGWMRLAAFSPDGELVAGVGGGTKIRIWELGNGKLLQEWKSGRSPHAVEFSPDGKLLAYGDGAGDPCLRFFEVESGNEVTPLEIFDGSGVTDLSYSPNGRTLAVARMSDKVHLWETTTGKLRLTITPPADVSCIAFSPDGRFLATAFSGSSFRTVDGAIDERGREDRGNIHLWDVFTGEKIDTLSGHHGGVTDMQFSGNGQFLVTGSADTSALVWDIDKVRRAHPIDRVNLNGQELEKLWNDLNGDDVPRAYQAIGRLVAARSESLAYLSAKLSEKVEVDPTRINKLVDQLDSSRFVAREKATAELTKLGIAAAPALKRALIDSESPEVRRRVREILDTVKVTSLQHARALEAIDHILAQR